MVDLLTFLDGVRLNNVVENRRIWKDDGSEFFSCRSLFYALISCDVSQEISAMSGLWKIKVPVKVKVLAG